MGAALPVVGAVVGVAGAVSQYSAQQQQANAQKQSLDQQALIEQHNTRLRLIELERQKLYSNFQFQIDTARREVAKFGDSQQLQLAAIYDQMQQQAAAFGVRQRSLQEQLANQELLNLANQTEFRSQMESLGVLGAETERGRQALVDAANQGASVNRMLDERLRARQEAMAQLSSGDVAGLSLSDLSNIANMQTIDEENAAAFLQKYRGIADQVSQGQLNAEFVSDLIKQLGANEVNFLRGSAARASDFTQDVEAFNLQEVQRNAQLSELGRQALSNAINTQYLIEEAQSELNRNYYDLARQAQSSAIQTSSAALQAQIAAQRNAIVSPSPLGLLGVGLQAYQSVAPTLRSQRPTTTFQFSSSNPLFTQRRDYGVLGSYALNPNYRFGDYY